MIKDRLNELLNEHDHLFGLICRDATLTDIELIAQAGYKLVWIDLEHSPIPTAEAIRLGRTIHHLGMVSMVRIPELRRTHVQVLLDGGIDIIILPDVRSDATAKEFVRLGKYPPIGERGAASTTARAGFAIGDDPKLTFEETNSATHLMAMIECDEGYDALNGILAVEGIDIINVGPTDWSVSLRIFGKEAESHLAPKIERIIRESVKASKIVAMGAFQPELAVKYRDMGVQITMVGADISMKRKVFHDTFTAYRNLLKSE